MEVASGDERRTYETSALLVQAKELVAWSFLARPGQRGV